MLRLYSRCNAVAAELATLLYFALHCPAFAPRRPAHFCCDIMCREVCMGWHCWWVGELSLYQQELPQQQLTVPALCVSGHQAWHRLSGKDWQLAAVLVPSQSPYPHPLWGRALTPRVSKRASIGVMTIVYSFTALCYISVWLQRLHDECTSFVGGSQVCIWTAPLS